MSLSSIKASTQDGTSGTPVAIVVNEDSGTNGLQAVAPVGNKTTYSEVSRTGLTGVDTGTTDLTTTGFAGSSGANLIDCGNALTLSIRANCDTAGKVLTGRMIFYDGSNNPLAFSETLSFSSDANLTIAASGQKFPSQRQLLDCGQARKCRFYVDTFAGTTWDVFVRPI